MPSQGTIGDRVRGLRLSRRMSQAQLAGPDLSDSYVSLIESGKRTPTPVVARLLAERLGCTTEFLLHGIEPRQRIDTELGLRHAELELQHGDPSAAAERFGEIVKVVGEENAMLAAHARLGRARALEAQGRIGPAVEAFERLRREAAAHPERLADLPLTVALSRCYQRAGDTLRAHDLAAQALTQVNRLALTQGEIAVDLAASLMETEASRGPDSPGLSYVRHILSVNGVSAVVNRVAEIHSLWQASIAAAEGEDSALAVRLADDAIATGRPARMAFRLARIAMDWSRFTASAGEERLDEAHELATAASGVFGAFSDRAHDHAKSLVVLAYVQLRSGNVEGAADLAGSVLDTPGGQSGVTAATAHLVLAQVALTRGEGDVTAILNSACGLLDGLRSGTAGPDREVARVWRELGDLYSRVGAGEEQASAYRRALEAAGVRSAMVGVTVDSALVR
ncbi:MULTISPECIES: helix-turn-helix domain-containing protein [Streptosporangium]|uniref:Transcriptional regulator with XRE-family HTH domain n=1 Tax=Streptosporangium brasiliense TaxID=47480 RepID=A0ABT9R6K4_9ACTN|nr:helix-turn-helix transcriptional regulator [Streptosporangium brasiliense]MDP9864050.1 transcriptional regulator with XRE-family HTH domain [Streptosporangium brasiliense]